MKEINNYILEKFKINKDIKNYDDNFYMFISENYESKIKDYIKKFENDNHHYRFLLDYDMIMNFKKDIYDNDKDGNKDGKYRLYHIIFSHNYDDIVKWVENLNFDNGVGDFWSRAEEIKFYELDKY